MRKYIDKLERVQRRATRFLHASCTCVHHKYVVTACIRTNVHMYNYVHTP